MEAAALTLLLLLPLWKEDENKPPWCWLCLVAGTIGGCCDEEERVTGKAEKEAERAWELAGR